MPDPTPEDRARDLRADLLLCGRATPGPWEWKHGVRVWPGEEIPGYTTPRLVGGGRVLLDVKNPGGGLPAPVCDLDLIAEARGGWPAALRRALAAEAECERLLALVNHLAAMGDRLFRCAERELVPGADLAREWAAAREGVGK